LVIKEFSFFGWEMCFRESQDFKGVIVKSFRDGKFFIRLSETVNI
jgi:hypothetical protein